MSRLTEKLTQAPGIVKRQTDKIEARADALIAREPKLEQRTDEAFSPHETLLREAESGLDALENALGQMTNFPLQHSGELLAPPTPVPELKLADSPPAVGQGDTFSDKAV